MKYNQFLLAQLVTARRTGDMDFAKELEAELEKPKDGMDETPENDEENLEEIYELPADVAEELSKPLVASVSQLAAVLKRLVGNLFYRIDNKSFGLRTDLPLNNLVKLLDATRADKRSIKVGPDQVYTYYTHIGTIQTTVDVRGCIDVVAVL